MAEELQRGNDFSSVQHLLKEVQDVLSIIRNYDASRGVDEGIDEVEQRPNVQTAMNNGEQKGANKRSHDTMIVPGHCESYSVLLVGTVMYYTTLVR